MSLERSTYCLHLEDGNPVKARSVVVATGAHYQRLGIPNYERFEYQGIHYAATQMESELCRDQQVVVVEAGNSAGRAALFLARTSARVYLLVRGDGLDKTMSDYLLHRIASSSRISVRFCAELLRMDGGERLQEVTLFPSALVARSGAAAEPARPSL